MNERGKLAENKRGCKYIEQQDGAAHIFAWRKLCKYFVCYRILTEIAIDFFLGISDWISLNVKSLFWFWSDGYFILSPLVFCIFSPYTHCSAIIKQRSFVEKKVRSCKRLETVCYVGQRWFTFVETHYARKRLKRLFTSFMRFFGVNYDICHRNNCACFKPFTLWFHEFWIPNPEFQIWTFLKIRNFVLTQKRPNKKKSWEQSEWFRIGNW